MVKSNDQEFITKLKSIDHNWNVISSIVTNHAVGLVSLYKDFRNDTIFENNLKLKICNL